MKKARPNNFRSSECLEFTKFDNLSPTPHGQSQYKLHAKGSLSMDFRKDKNVIFMAHRDRKRWDEFHEKDVSLPTDQFQKRLNKNEKSRDTVDKKDNNSIRKNISLGFKNRFEADRKNNLIMHFISKLKKNSIYRQPVIYQPFEKCEQIESEWKGFCLPKKLFMLYNFMSVVIIFFSCFIASLLMYFTQSIKGFALNYCFSFIIAWFILQVVLGFVVVKQHEMKKLIGLKQIGLNYLKSQFFIDFFCILVFILEFVEDFQLQSLCRMLVFLKVPSLISKFKIVQNKFVDIFAKEQYYGLIKMFFTNFLLFHIIGVGLLLMSKLNSEDNWLIKKQIRMVEWYEQYIWAFYWSATTMLTVGFGDISPANYKEALAVVVIETVSCMLLAYNINLMGKFLNQLRDQQIEKEKDLRILKQTCKKFEISNDLEFKLTTHVKESHKVQYKQQFYNQSRFVQKLPVNLQTEFLRDTNKNVFMVMGFFKNFTNKSVCRIAEKLNSKLAHPWETVYTLSKKELVILRQGKIGTCPTHKNKPCEQSTIDILESGQNKNFKLISTNLMTRQFKTQNYDFRSIGYSIINSLDFCDFLNILKEKAVDFEWFLSNMDREKKETEQQNEQIQCIQCRKNHSKFNCPLLHYFPTRQIVIYKSLKKFQKSKVYRKQLYREKIQISPLKLFKRYNQKNRQTSQPDISSYCLITSEKELNKYRLVNKQTNSYDRISKQKKNSTILHLAESVKKQILGELNGKEKEVLFWAVQCDQAHNFKYYFPLMNAKNLQSIHLSNIVVSKKPNPVSKTKTLKKMFSN